MASKTSNVLDWVQRVEALWQLLLAIGAGTAIKAALKAYTQIGPEWILPIWLSASAIVLFVLMRLSASFVSKSLQQNLPASQSQLPGVNFELAAKQWDDLYTQNGGPYREEIERYFEGLTAPYRDNEAKCGFLIRTLSAGAVAHFHEVTWMSILRSQIDALNRLNVQGGTNADGLMPFYEEGARRSPAFYKRWAFTNWLDYMRGQTLVRQDGDVFQITVKGKDFLRYMVFSGKNPQQRNG